MAAASIAQLAYGLQRLDQHHDRGADDTVRRPEVRIDLARTEPDRPQPGVGGAARSHEGHVRSKQADRGLDSPLEVVEKIYIGAQLQACIEAAGMLQQPALRKQSLLDWKRTRTAHLRQQPRYPPVPPQPATADDAHRHVARDQIRIS